MPFSPKGKGKKQLEEKSGEGPSLVTLGRTNRIALDGHSANVVLLEAKVAGAGMVVHTVAQEALRKREKRSMSCKR